MIINKTNQTDLSGLYFVYRGSTNLEKPGWRGVIHLGEHLKCKCIDDLMDDFQENGISWNAYTSDSYIVFYFTGLERFLAPFRNKIIDRMYQPISNFVREEELENEKKIVLEEYDACFTDQDSVFYYNHMRKQYDYYSPIGLRTDIENFTKEEFDKMYELQYNKPDMIINISKDFILENNSLEFEDRNDKLITEFKPNKKSILEKEIDIDNNMILMFEQIVDKDDYVGLTIINNMLGSGLNSPLYKEIREKRQLCYSVSIYSTKMGDMERLIIWVNTNPKNEEEIKSTLEEVLSNKEKYLTQERLDLVTKSYIISKEKGLINRHSSISDILDPNIEKLYNILEDITLDDIYKVYNKYYNLNSFKKITTNDSK